MGGKKRISAATSIVSREAHRNPSPLVAQPKTKLAASCNVTVELLRCGGEAGQDRVSDSILETGDIRVDRGCSDGFRGQSLHLANAALDTEDPSVELMLFLE